MPRHVRAFSIAVILLLTVQTSLAQAPEGINYQAVARDGSGAVLTGESIQVRLSIKENGPAGTTAFQETHNVTTNDFGLFDLVIGQGSEVTGTFSNLDWGNDSHFLQVEVDDGSGYTNMGTSQFVSVPYALYAKSAGGGGGSYTAGSGIEISGNVISNTGDPDGSDDVTTTSNAGGDASGNFDNITVVGLQGNSVSSAAPANGQILKWNGSTWAPANDVGGGTGDDWGSQSVQSDATLEGNGTNGSFLKVARQGATNGELLKWDGTSWIPAADANTTYSAGNGLELNGTTFSNTGDTDASDDITNTTSAGGDLSGTYPNPSVEKIHGRTVSGTAPANGEVMKWNDSTWAPATDGGSSWSKDGNYTYTFDSVGIGTDKPLVGLHVRESVDVLFGDTTAGVTGPRLMWIAKKGALRAGIETSFFGVDTIGIFSVAFGRNTKAEGYNSTAMGQNTIASGNSSTAMGYQTNASGSSSTAMGQYASASGSNSTAMGWGPDATGTTSTAMGSNTEASGSSSTAMGSGTEASGPNSTAMGYNTHASGHWSTAMGLETEAPSSTETVVGRYNTSYTPKDSVSWNGDDRLFVIGNGESSFSRSDAMVVLKNGNTGFGISDPDHRVTLAVSTKSTPDGDGLGLVNAGNYWNFHMSSSFLRFSANNTNVSYIHSTSGAYNQTSDQRLKENIQPNEPLLAKVNKLNVVRYNYRHDDQQTPNIGLLAQEVQPLFPELVSKDEGSEYYGLNYSGLGVIAIKAIQEQQEIIDRQQATIERQAMENQAFQKELNRIKSALAEEGISIE